MKWFVVQDAEQPPAYCKSIPCTCGNECHTNVNYHLFHTTWDGVYPQLSDVTDEDDYAYAVVTLGGNYAR